MPVAPATDTLALLHALPAGAGDHADQGRPHLQRVLEGRHVAVVSGGERVDASIEVFVHAAQSLGARVARLMPADLGLRPDREEHDAALSDEALRLLGRFYSAVGCAGLSDANVARLRRHCGVPVFVDLAQGTHATRLLADVMTLQEMQTAHATGTQAPANGRPRLGLYGAPDSPLLHAWAGLADEAGLDLVDLSGPGAESLAASCNFICQPTRPPALFFVTPPSARRARQAVPLADRQERNHLLVVQALLRDATAGQG